jgi:MFS family permease
MIGGIENIASVVAPLIGGILTTYVSWRWCFYINLPIGGVTLLVIFFLFENPAGQKISTENLKTKLIAMNPLGLGAFIGSIVCLLLALQWGGVTYAWSSGRVVAVLVVFAVSFVLFWVLEIWKRDQAVFPGRVILHPTVILSLVYGFCTAAAISVMSYYVSAFTQVSLLTLNTVSTNTWPTIASSLVSIHQGCICSAIRSQSFAYDYRPYRHRYIGGLCR